MDFSSHVVLQAQWDEEASPFALIAYLFVYPSWYRLLAGYTVGDDGSIRHYNIRHVGIMCFYVVASSGKESYEVADRAEIPSVAD
ncbi:MAG: hypothetical protein M1836_007348 [Candelina mexicana]|nr:MAG: hypothetical protein M1836_007348 [Candelina mexicana]